MKLELIELKGFRSIKCLRINNLESLSVFAGSHGAGKSNLMDALHFMSLIIRIGAIEAVISFGGYENIISRDLKEKEEVSFSIKIKDNQDDIYEYSVTIGLAEDGENACILDEKLYVNERDAVLGIKNMYTKINGQTSKLLQKIEKIEGGINQADDVTKLINELKAMRLNLIPFF